ncbi:hypothetical protein SAMN05444287_0365 [Octadecabacter temperatus]|uniref:Uncharacterized protein n=1 Tax=Octadecabacter temperatus TaxID=1458307 RepID=A0A0K0Y2V7_9RHOB|nr:hypothetical protein [Octadecabacter temperatus]AKS45273.1 hypothetical protein OSB_07120 [Octadecabacter temperatus]SIN89572.1 hypothetical protein SAMN05444287_0365 [Octadecabacter temperatus]
MRVLAIILSLLATIAAADHGTETQQSGPSLGSQVWLDSFQAQIAQCYSPGGNTSRPVAFAAVSFQMAPNTRPFAQTIQLSAPSGRAGEAQALEAARRAITRCGQNGYDLPLDQFSQWQFVEIRFFYYVP